MKPKEQRVFYERKQLKRTDPKRVCKSWGSLDGGPGLHDEGGVLFVEIDYERKGMRYRSSCAWCGARIEGFLPVEHMAKLNAIEWRTEQYVITEEPW